MAFALLYSLMIALFGTFTWNTEHVAVYGSMPALLKVLFGVLIVLYYILLEGYLGQTLGKMLLRIKVVREDTGKVPGLGAATIRTLLRLIDGLFDYLVSFISSVSLLEEAALRGHGSAYPRSS